MSEPAAMPRSLAAVVFDAYGTLFDLAEIAGGVSDILGKDIEAFALLWRRKQLEYTWLRALMGDYDDFWQVTGEALDYALAAMGREDPGLRARLMQRHMNVPAFPDVVPALTTLKSRGLKTAILSNGSPTMITAAVNASRLRKLLDHILSVDAVRSYKPHPTVYALAPAALQCEPLDIAFVSANGWDIAGAAHFGFRAVWLNRAKAPVERLPARPMLEIASLAELADALPA
ncbi:MAG TPA: haloacid dehalogenase type II [Alphaproteobacteria bacterium]|nr:haloacid dehalogenase type II [Alphaproteobacteria bacterium]